MENIRTEYEAKACPISIVKLISSFVNWLPVFLITNMVISEVYNPNIPPRHASYFGRWSYREVQMEVAQIIFLYVVSIIVFKWKMTTSNTSLHKKLSKLKRNLRRKHLLEYINRLFPNTIRVINGDNFGILMIGTCHLSASSAVQTSEIIKMIEPSDVLLELDAKRAASMFEDDVIHQYALIDDLFQVKTYSDPIILFLRIGSRCVSYFSELGEEFKQSLLAANNCSNDCNVIFGDQDSIKTAESVEKATPFWLKILLNLFIIFGFFGPFMSAFYYVIMDFSKCILAQCYLLLVCKIFISLVTWKAYTLWSKLFIQIWAEESKNSMQRMLKFYSFLGYFVPALTRTLKKSDLKSKRDQILAQNTLKCLQKQQQNETKLIVTVTGLAHLDSIHSIVTKMIKCGHLNQEMTSVEM